MLDENKRIDIFLNLCKKLDVGVLRLTQFEHFTIHADTIYYKGFCKYLDDSGMTYLNVRGCKRDFWKIYILFALCDVQLKSFSGFGFIKSDIRKSKLVCNISEVRPFCIDKVKSFVLVDDDIVSYDLALVKLRKNKCVSNILRDYQYTYKNVDNIRNEFSDIIIDDELLNRFCENFGRIVLRSGLYEKK